MSSKLQDARIYHVRDGKYHVKREGVEGCMYIHLGGEKIIRASELVAIFDISIEQSSKLSKQFVTQARKAERS